MKSIYFLAAVIFLYACGAPNMAFNDASTPKESYTVKGRQGWKSRQKLAFGQFNTTNIQRSGTRASSSQYGAVGYVWTSYEQKKQTFRFKLTDNRAQSSEVFCITNMRSEELLVGRNPNSLVNIFNEFSVGSRASVFA